MRIGILGTGFGAYHGSIYKKLDSVDSIIIYGRDKSKLDEIKNELDIEVTDNIYDIIEDSRVDLVDICLPSSIHKKYVIKSLAKGKDVFCETPVCLTKEDAIAIREAENKYGKRVFVNLFIKHEFPYKYLHEKVMNNSLGQLKALHIKRKTPPLWGDLGLSKITTNLMIHELDFITWILGSPNNISAVGMESKKGQSHVDAILNYGDTFVEVQCSSMMPDYHPFTVGYEAIFEDGTIEFIENGYEKRQEQSLKLFTNDREENIDIISRDCYRESIEHVIECCLNGNPSMLSLKDAIKSLEIALYIKDVLV